MLSLDQLVRIMRSPSKRTSAFARIAAAKIVLALAQGERVAIKRARRLARLEARWCFHERGWLQGAVPDEMYKERGRPGLGEDDLATAIARHGPTRLGRGWLEGR
jgi:hypothetical protein